MAGIRHFHRQAHGIPSPLFYLEVSTDFSLLPPLRQKNKKIESPSVEERPNLLTNLPSKWSAHRQKRDSSREESRDAPFQTGMLSRFSSLRHPGILRIEEDAFHHSFDRGPKARPRDLLRAPDFHLGHLFTFLFNADGAQFLSLPYGGLQILPDNLSVKLARFLPLFHQDAQGLWRANEQFVGVASGNPNLSDRLALFVNDMIGVLAEGEIQHAGYVPVPRLGIRLSRHHGDQAELPPLRRGRQAVLRLGGVTRF